MPVLSHMGLCGMYRGASVHRGDEITRKVKKTTTTHLAGDRSRHRDVHDEGVVGRRLAGFVCSLFPLIIPGATPRGAPHGGHVPLAEPRLWPQLEVHLERSLALQEHIGGIAPQGRGLNTTLQA